MMPEVAVRFEVAVEGGRCVTLTKQIYWLFENRRPWYELSESYIVTRLTEAEVGEAIEPVLERLQDELRGLAYGMYERGAKATEHIPGRDPRQSDLMKLLLAFVAEPHESDRHYHIRASAEKRGVHFTDSAALVMKDEDGEEQPIDLGRKWAAPSGSVFGFRIRMRIAARDYHATYRLDHIISDHVVETMAEMPELQVGLFSLEEHLARAIMSAFEMRYDQRPVDDSLPHFSEPPGTSP